MGPPKPPEITFNASRDRAASISEKTEHGINMKGHKAQWDSMLI